MAVVMSTRMAAAAYLFFLLVSLANTAAIDRLSSSTTSSSSSEQEWVGDSNNLYSGEIDDGSNYRRALVILKRVLSRAAKSPDPTAELMAPFRKRTCYFNAGMSHSCDYKELLKSVDDANYWSSDFTPGRRRKRQFNSSRGASVAPTIRPF